MRKHKNSVGGRNDRFGTRIIISVKLSRGFYDITVFMLALNINQWSGLRPHRNSPNSAEIGVTYANGRRVTNLLEPAFGDYT